MTSDGELHPTNPSPENEPDGDKYPGRKRRRRRRSKSARPAEQPTASAGEIYLSDDDDEDLDEVPPLPTYGMRWDDLSEDEDAESPPPPPRKQPPAGSRQRAAASGQAAAGSRQPPAGSRQRAAGSRQPAPSGKPRQRPVKSEEPERENDDVTPPKAKRPTVEKEKAPPREKAASAKARPAAKEPMPPREEPVPAKQRMAAKEPAPPKEKPAPAKARPAAKEPMPPREEPASAKEPMAAKEPAPPKEKPAPAKRRTDRTDGFAAMDLSEVMMNALDAAGYIEPTPVQGGLIPRALAGIDVMGQAQTGTGKTAAFAIPILEQLNPHRKGAAPQALALVPTRELAVQVRDECDKLAAGRNISILAVYGGKPIRQQIEHLTRGAAMVVGTPGRVLDLMSRGALVLGELRFVVLDEADRMLDIGFRPDIEKILRRCPASRQTLLLSATIPPPVKRLAERYMRDPEMLDFSPTNLAVETIEQSYFTVDPVRKFDLLVQLLEREKPKQAIIFCRTKRGTEKVHMRLARRFPNVDTIHGDLQQSSRDRVMKGFRAGTVHWLVATDVVGRGIDVSGISHIINYDIPQFSDDYVHRVGRTGRMGREGIAFTFVAPEEGNELTRIEMRINRLLKRDEIPGFQAFGEPQPSSDALAAPTVAGEEAESGEPPAPKPVFGRPMRKIRRAL
jgi:ATP-dependent RNA helicase DeaD